MLVTQAHVPGNLKTLRLIFLVDSCVFILSNEIKTIFNYKVSEFGDKIVSIALKVLGSDQTESVADCA